ncbi:hypothetical protein [Anaerohalosphaera lusitana]|nr:hypothetical protein [Anaerohalosphaera lusitana]
MNERVCQIEFFLIYCDRRGGRKWRSKPDFFGDTLNKYLQMILPAQLDCR